MQRYPGIYINNVPGWNKFICFVVAFPLFPFSLSSMFIILLYSIFQPIPLTYSSLDGFRFHTPCSDFNAAAYHFKSILE
jgi:hypothetical protein